LWMLGLEPLENASGPALPARPGRRLQGSAFWIVRSRFRPMHLRDWRAGCRVTTI